MSEEIPPHTRATPDPQPDSLIASETVAPEGMGLRRRLTALAVDVTPLRESREFRLLFIGQGVSFAGSMITYVAVPFQVYQLTRSSLVVGLVSLAELVPILLMSFVGGALADAVDRRRMVRITQISACGVVCVLVVNAALPHPQLWVLFVVVIAAAGVDSLERPSLDALVPRIVSRDRLTAAAALESLRGNLGQVLGPPLAGILIATVGLPATYGVDVATFLVATLALTLMRAVPPAPDAEGVSLRAAIAGLRYAAGRQDLLGSYLVDINAMFFGMPMALFPQIASGLGGPAVLGLLYTAPSVGSLHCHRDKRVDALGASSWPRDRVRRSKLGSGDHRVRLRAVALGGAARACSRRRRRHDQRAVSHHAVEPDDSRTRCAAASPASR